MNNNNQPVTKKELDEILEHKLHQWTKKEIVPTVESMFDKFGEKIKKEVTDAKNEIIKSNDKLAGEIKKDREEFMATVMLSKQADEKFQEHDKILKNHAGRLKVLDAGNMQEL